MKKQSYTYVNNAKDTIVIKVSRCAKNVQLFRKIAITARQRQLEFLMTYLFVIPAGKKDWRFVKSATLKLELLAKNGADSAKI